MTKTWLTVRQVADRAKVAEGSVRRWLDDPTVPLTKQKSRSGRVLIDEAEADAWLEERETPRPVAPPDPSS